MVAGTISLDDSGVTEFRTSSTPILLGMLALVAYTFGALRYPSDRSLPIHSSPEMWPHILAAEAATLFICAWCLLRPTRVLANRWGFTLSGMLIRSSEIQPWTDVDHFLITSAGRQERVACALKPHAQRRFSTRWGSTDQRAVLATFFPSDPHKTVDALNALLRTSLGEHSVTADNGWPETTRGDLRHRAQTMQPTVVRSSRPLYIFMFAICLSAAVLVGVAEVKLGWLSDPRMQLGELMLIVITLIMLWLALFPPRIEMEGKGFTVAGGFTFTKVQKSWNDVDYFMVYFRPPSSRYIAYLPSSSDPTRSDTRKWASTKILYTFVVFKKDAIVNQLNDYREAALATARSKSIAD